MNSPGPGKLLSMTTDEPPYTVRLGKGRNIAPARLTKLHDLNILVWHLISAVNLTLGACSPDMTK